MAVVGSGRAGVNVVMVVAVEVIVQFNQSYIEFQWIYRNLIVFSSLKLID